METINYNHLFYFWVVAREGGLVPAAKLLHLSHPTLSAQIHTLEDRLGEKLFTKVGRKLILTEIGQRKLKNPAVLTISQAAHHELFAAPSAAGRPFSRRINRR